MMSMPVPLCTYDVIAPPCSGHTSIRKREFSITRSRRSGVFRQRATGSLDWPAFRVCTRGWAGFGCLRFNFLSGVAMAKNNNSSSLLVDLARLPEGFHQRRIARDGVGFEAYIWRGAPGPVLLVNGATHGDEYEGPTL